MQRSLEKAILEEIDQLDAPWTECLAAAAAASRNHVANGMPHVANGMPPMPMATPAGGGWLLPPAGAGGERERADRGRPRTHSKAAAATRRARAAPRAGPPAPDGERCTDHGEPTPT